MKFEQALHMVGGAGETSYASNSRLQEKGILKTKNIIREALATIYDDLFPESLVVADLGCSSGPNVFLVMSHIIDAVGGACMVSGRRRPKEIWFMLNDLPNNDFNSIFRSLPEQQEMKLREDELMLPSCYVAGVPGSFYGRLFPCHSLHFVHSSYSLMWLSQVPVGLESEMGEQLNEGNITISKTSPAIVSRLYYEQFKRDFSSFLRQRYEELVTGGRMVLSFLGRRCLDPSSAGLCVIWSLLGTALNSMAQEGLLEAEMVKQFNMPLYPASMEEVKSVIESEGSFDLQQDQIFESNCDPFDDTTHDSVDDHVTSGLNVAKCIRAVGEPILVSHFGGNINIDELFARHAECVTRQLLKEKTKYAVLVVTLKKRG